MGFMDKAKKMAEQAQAKLDEAQGQFNAGQQGTGAAGGPPPVEYDQHGRPVPASDAPPAPAEAVPPVPLADPTGPAPETVAPVTEPPPAPAAPAAAAPAPPAPAPSGEDSGVDRTDEQAPTLTSGDPLAG